VKALTFSEPLRELIKGGTLAHALDESAIVLLRVNKGAVHDITIVVADADKGNFLATSPSRSAQRVEAFLVSGEREAAEDGSQLWDQVILQVPARADDVDRLKALGLGIFANCMFFYRSLEPANTSLG
jgi:hypothetical protein